MMKDDDQFEDRLKFLAELQSSLADVQEQKEEVLIELVGILVNFLTVAVEHGMLEKADNEFIEAVEEVIETGSAVLAVAEEKGTLQ